MKKNVSSIIVILTLISLLVATFFLQYEFLFLTRIASLIFAIVYLVVEVKQEYFSTRKPLFIFFSVISILAITVCIILDETSATDGFNARSFITLIFVLNLLVINYRNLYKKTTLLNNFISNLALLKRGMNVTECELNYITFRVKRVFYLYFN